MQVFKILNGHSPISLVDLISRHVPTRALRSRDTNLLAVPRFSSKFGDRRFNVSGPRLWNDLPTYIPDYLNNSLFQIKASFKTITMRKNYPPSLFESAVFGLLVHCSTA